MACRMVDQSGGYCMDYEEFTIVQGTKELIKYIDKGKGPCSLGVFSCPGM